MTDAQNVGEEEERRYGDPQEIALSFGHVEGRIDDLEVALIGALWRRSRWGTRPRGALGGARRAVRGAADHEGEPYARVGIAAAMGAGVLLVRGPGPPFAS